MSLITSSPMAAALPLLGQRVLSRLANAELIFGAQSVFGLLSDEPVELSLGGLAVEGRRKIFTAMAADLDALAGSAAIGQACAIAGDPLGTAWQVAQRINHLQTGQASLHLERA